ncbi:MAG: efflux RND transporter permease subunit [Marinilabiliales bacterium]|nr:efflux RND transporter permease subunit [Marinilabiliales bacterium]
MAKVEVTYADIRAIHRINGQPTVNLTVSKERGANTLRVARDVKLKLEEVKRELPLDLVFKAGDDESLEIRKNLNDLYLLAGLITAIVFVMVFVVLRRVMPSLLILSSIAFSIVITFNLIYAFGISLNMLTLGALALGFGMFVDNSIVVFENILRLREGGMEAREASVQGPREVFTAVLASTLTTMAVFFSFPFFQGKLKIYYLPLAIVIASAMAASLLVSFTLVPSLSPRLLKKRKRDGSARRRGARASRRPSAFSSAIPWRSCSSSPPCSSGPTSGSGPRSPWAVGIPGIRRNTSMSGSACRRGPTSPGPTRPSAPSKRRSRPRITKRR